MLGNLHEQEQLSRRQPTVLHLLEIDVLVDFGIRQRPHILDLVFLGFRVPFSGAIGFYNRGPFKGFGLSLGPSSSLALVASSSATLRLGLQLCNQPEFPPRRRRSRKRRRSRAEIGMPTLLGIQTSLFC